MNFIRFVVIITLNCNIIVLAQSDSLLSVKQQQVDSILYRLNNNIWLSSSEKSKDLINLSVLKLQLNEKEDAVKYLEKASKEVKKNRRK